MILHVPRHTGIGVEALKETALIENFYGDYNEFRSSQGNTWVKSINHQERYGLHRICSSMGPSEDTIYQTICEQGGLHSMAKKNSVGITPSEYLTANPYADEKICSRENWRDSLITCFYEDLTQ